MNGFYKVYTTLISAVGRSGGSVRIQFHIPHCMAGMVIQSVIRQPVEVTLFSLNLNAINMKIYTNLNHLIIAVRSVITKGESQPYGFRLSKKT